MVQTMTEAARILRQGLDYGLFSELHSEALRTLLARTKIAPMDYKEEIKKLLSEMAQVHPAELLDDPKVTYSLSLKNIDKFVELGMSLAYSVEAHQ